MSLVIVNIMSQQTSDIRFGDKLFKNSLKLIALSVTVLLALMVYQLADMSQSAFETFGFNFLITNVWDPVREQYGALAFAYGTLVSSLLALLIACPISIGTALFLTEIAPKKLAKVVGFLVEMLAAIPSVVYGIWGILVLAPWLRDVLEPFLAEHFGFLPIFQGPMYGIGMLAGGIVLAIMITPTIASISREIFLKTPQHVKEAAYALGATKWEMIQIAILKNSHSGLIGAVVLGLGRALGETMAVTMVIGNRADISLSLFDPGHTMASVIANEYTEATSDLHLAALVGVGLTLFLIALTINGLARTLIWRLNSEARG